MTRWRSTTACERAAQWISLDVDGELGRLEQAALVRHLRRCDRCRDLSGEIQGFTSLLRAEPPVDPQRAVPVVTPDWARKKARTTLRAGLLALCIALALGGAVSAFLPSGHGSPGSGMMFATPKQHRLFVRARMLNEPVLYTPVALTPAESFSLRPLL